MTFLFMFSLSSVRAQHVGSPYGFAAVPGYGVSTTTGGTGGEVVIINGQQDAKKLQDALDDDDNPKIIYIYGSVQLPEYTNPAESPVSDLSDRMTKVRSNKTILGATADATIYGSGLSIYSGSGEGVDPQLTAVNNIIIQNIHFEGWYDDAINIQGGSHHVWIDHCTFSNGYDGAVDTKRASDLVTISYSHVYDHGKMSLVGHSTDVRDADMGHLRITYDHIWWDDSGTRSSRHPRIRHGIVHQTNSFFQGQSPDSAIDGIVCNEDGRLTVENCFFENPKWFTEVAYGDSNPGQVKERNNGFVGCKACDNGETVWNGKIDWNASFSDLTGEYPDYPSADPSDYYAYTLEDASTVKATVTSNSGAGVISIPDPGQGTTYYTLSTSTNGSGSVNPNGGSYADGASVSVTATPVSGWEFTSWSGAATGSTNPVTITMDNNKSLIANFSQITGTTYNLSVTTVGQGSVSPNGGTYADGSSITLTATPASGYVFDSWSGDVSGTNSSVAVTMDANKSVTATFTQQQTGGGGEEIHNFTESGLSSSFYSISGNLSDTKGTVNYEGMTLTQCLKIESSTLISFTSGQDGDLTLVFNEGWSGGFEIDGVSQNVSNGILTTTLAAGSHTLTKDDVANLYYMELAYAGGGTTQYTVTTSANGSGTVSGSGTYDEGSVISLTATPASGYQFDGWSGDASGTSNPLSVTVDGEKSITANFSIIPPTQYSLTTSVIGSGAVTPSSGTFDENTQVTLTATPASGYVFDSWSGDASGTNSSVTITMNANKSVTATFTQQQTGGGGEEIHNFTESGLSSSFYSISGNLSGSKGTVSYEGMTLTQCLKIESSTLISFTSGQDGDLTLVFNEGWSGGFEIDGVSQNVSNGILTVSLAAGSHTLTKDNVANLYYMELAYAGGGTTQYTVTTSANGNGSISGGGTYDAGSVISLAATPNSGYQFDGWSGDASGTNNPLSVTVNSNLNIIGNFVEIPSTGISLAASGGDGQVVLTWTVSNTTLTSQEVFRDTDSNFSGSVSLGSVSTSQTSFTDNTVTNGTTYYYWIEGNTASGTLLSNSSSATPNDGPSVDPSLVGFATLTGGTTGGSGGVSVTCGTGDCILGAISDKKNGIISQPLTIYVNGTITPSNTSNTKIDVKDVRDVSIIGVGTSGEFDGIGIKVTRAGNVIIQNITVHHVDIGDKDAISIEGPADHVWVDHCELYADYQGTDKDYYDGLLDAKSDSEYITYSWNYLHDSWKMMLVGSSDGDDHDRKITIHHNWFENVNSRMPLYRFGTGHVFNNYYDGVVSTGINSRMGACLKVENNYFENAHNPIVSAYSSELGAVDESGTIYVNVTWDLSGDTNEPLTCTSNLPYSYASVLHNTANVPSIVMQNAGVGKISGGARISDVVQQPIAVTTDIYPNPASNMIKVSISDFHGDEVIRVLNLSGVEMMKSQMTEGLTELDISTLAGGAYILHISSGEQSVVKRFIKQ